MKPSSLVDGGRLMRSRCSRMAWPRPKSTSAGIRWLEALVIPAVGVEMLDEVLDLGVELARQIMNFRAGWGSFKRLVPALDLPLGLRMAGCPMDVGSSCSASAFRQNNRRHNWGHCPTEAGVCAGHGPDCIRRPARPLQRGGDILGVHRRAQLPGDDVREKSSRIVDGSYHPHPTTWR